MKQKKEVRLGDLAFYGGKRVKVIAECHKHSWAVIDDGAVGCFTSKVVYKSDVQPLAKEIFAVGDKVRSQNSFRGEVVGFEERSNRVVCISEKNIGTNDRQRYAYKVDELEFAAPPLFKANGAYDVMFMNDSLKVVCVRALKHPAEKEKLVLYSAYEGEPLAIVPVSLTEENMGMHRISKVRCLDA